MHETFCGFSVQTLFGGHKQCMLATTDEKNFWGESSGNGAEESAKTKNNNQKLFECQMSALSGVVSQVTTTTDLFKGKPHVHVTVQDGKIFLKTTINPKDPPKHNYNTCKLLTKTYFSLKTG